VTCGTPPSPRCSFTCLTLPYDMMASFRHLSFFSSPFSQNGLCPTPGPYFPGCPTGSTRESNGFSAEKNLAPPPLPTQPASRFASLANGPPPPLLSSSELTLVGGNLQFFFGRKHFGFKGNTPFQLPKLTFIAPR